MSSTIGTTKTFRVRRLMDPSLISDPWTKKFIELADGRTIEDIATSLYWEEIKLGAWLADIGLLKDQFRQEVVMTIRWLASSGHVYLEAATEEGKRG